LRQNSVKKYNKLSPSIINNAYFLRLTNSVKLAKAMGANALPQGGAGLTNVVSAQRAFVNIFINKSVFYSVAKINFFHTYSL